MKNIINDFYSGGFLMDNSSFFPLLAGLLVVIFIVCFGYFTEIRNKNK